jgi:hypothetical protein
MTPYWDFPQLLSLLLRLLHEGNLAKGRCEVMRVLGEWSSQRRQGGARLLLVG